MCQHLFNCAEEADELKAPSAYSFKVIYTDEDIVDEEENKRDEVMNTDEDIVDEGEKKREEVVETLKKVGVAVGVVAEKEIMGEHLLKYAEETDELKAPSAYSFKVMNTDEGIVDVGVNKRQKVVETLKKVGVAVGVVAAVAVGVVAGVALFGWGISNLVNGNDDDENKKMMKAPGRDNCYIERAVFENNAKAYFRELRKK